MAGGGCGGGDDELGATGGVEGLRSLVCNACEGWFETRSRSFRAREIKYQIECETKVCAISGSCG